MCPALPTTLWATTRDRKAVTLMPKVRKIHVRPQDSSVFQQGVDGECGGLRVAAYARVSTEQESQSNSFQAQKDYYEKLITTTPGWTYAGIYADENAIIGLSRKAA